VGPRKESVGVRFGVKRSPVDDGENSDTPLPRRGTKRTAAPGGFPANETKGADGDLTLLRRVFDEARPYRGRIVAVFGLSLLATPLALLGPVPLKMAVDNVLGSEPLSGVLATVVPDWFESSTTRLLVLTAVLQVLVVVLIQTQAAVTRVWTTSTVERLTLSFRARLLQHVQRMSFAFHDRRGTAESIYRIQYDAPAISNLAVTTIIPFLSSTLTVVAMIYVIVRIDWQLAAVALMIAPMLYLLGRWYRKRMRPRYKEAKRLESSALGVVQEVLTSFRVIKSFGTEERERRRYESKSAESVDARVELATAEGVFGVLVSLTTALGTAAVLFIGVRNVQAGVLSLGEMLLVISYVAQLYTPLKTVSRKVASLQNQLTSAKRAFDLIDELPEVQERPDARPLRRADGNLHLIDVSFSYEPGEPVLERLSLEVEPGTRLGIAGPTGAGKTTLVGLLSRFYDVDSGTIQLDAIDIRDYRLKDLRRQFAIMPQEPVLFSTSILENISYSNPDASWTEILTATEAAGAVEFASALPEGFDTLVGERGMRLSGGERQRISLARAFLKDAPILILDEPTSSVDLETEREIMESLEILMEGRTTLMIAHRRSTLEVCDMVIELQPATASGQPDSSA
jgi:ATP-binding cassette subfamily B protein